MEKIDWDKAPEGATHCDHRYMEFYRAAKNRKGGEFYDLNGGGWMMLCDDFSSLVREPYVVQRPSPAWSGEGLPPVGEVVQVVDDGSLVYGHGEKGPVVAHVEGCAVVRMSYGLGCFSAGSLKPIRTPEQIAKDEREAACEAMLEITKSRRPDPDVYEAIATLYDAGYRKQDAK